MRGPRKRASRRDASGAARRLLLACFAVVGALASAGCGLDDQAPDAFRVALLTPGSVRDGGWNQSAYEGLQQIERELGARTAHQETQTPQDFEAGFRDFAARGYDLVFGHGFEFQDAAAKVSNEFPDTLFVTTSGSTVRPNVAPIVFELEQATYVLGYVGAAISRTGGVGAVGGVKIPSVASTFTAFEAGARAARGDAQVTISYIGNWTDVAAAREATLALIDGGSDVLIHNANEAAAGFFKAVAESEGALAFGTNRDQNGEAPGSVLASATLNVPRALLLVARQAQAGEFQARPIRFGLADGVVGITWNDALRARVPDAVRRDAERLVDEIRSGALQVPRGGF